MSERVDSAKIVKLLVSIVHEVVDMEEVPTNFVPAVAVTRKGQALSVMIRRKEFVGDSIIFSIERKESSF